METSRREKRSYMDEFKHQIIMLYQNAKTKSELFREYDLTPSALHKWIKNFDQSGSFKQKDNFTLEEKRLIELEKENKQLKMENEILKQAALILGRKS
jgi:transposase